VTRLKSIASQMRPILFCFQYDTKSPSPPAVERAGVRGRSLQIERTLVSRRLLHSAVKTVAANVNSLILKMSEPIHIGCYNPRIGNFKFLFLKNGSESVILAETIRAWRPGA